MAHVKFQQFDLHANIKGCHLRKPELGSLFTRQSKCILSFHTKQQVTPENDCTVAEVDTIYLKTLTQGRSGVAARTRRPVEDMEQQDLHSQIAARPKATRESNSQNSPQQMDAEPRPAATCRSSAQTCTVVSGGYPSADPFVTPSGPQPSAARKWTEYHYHYTYVTPSPFSPIMSGTSRGHSPFSRHRAGGLGQVPDTGDPDSRHDSFLDRRWRHYMRASRDYVRASRDFTGCHLSRDDTMYLVAYAQVNESPDEECLRYIGKRVRASDQQILAWFAYYCQVIRPTTPRVCYGNCMLNSPDFLQGPDIWDVGIANLAMLDASKGTVSRDLLQDNDIRDMGEASLEKVDTIWT